MRILIATGLYPPEIGGPATHTKLLETYLSKHNYYVEVIPFNTVRMLPPVFRHLWYTWKLFRAARHADIVLAQDTVSVGVPAALATRFTRTPLVIRISGDYAWEQGKQRFGVLESIDDFQTRRYGFSVELLRAFQRFAANSAIRLVVPSNYFKSLVEGWGVRKELVETIYNGIEHITPRRPETLPQSPFIVSAGRLVPWKGFPLLIELLPELPGWTLVIIGDGPMREALEKKAIECGVSERVCFTGSLPRDELAGWLECASAFVLNTSFESFSFQVVEAMAAGTPVIATNVGSIPEIIENGKEGVLLAPNHRNGFCTALRSVREEKGLWSARTEAARRKAERFTSAHTAEEFCRLFEKIRQGSSARAEHSGSAKR